MKNMMSVTIPPSPSRSRARLPRIAARLAFLPLVLSVSARAAVTEPPIPPAATGEAVPKPTPAAETGVVTSRGFTAMDVTLEGLFTSRGEMIDPVKDAQTAPGTFSPQCGFTGEFVLHGGGCHVGLGWYNATEGA